VETVIAASALQAIREIEQSEFDLVVSDLEMPGMWGPDLLEFIAERWPGTWRILLTGHTSADLLQRASTYADLVLDKILDTEIITAAVCKMAMTPRRH
jgi:DNA-binding NtrC family response regulator